MKAFGRSHLAHLKIGRARALSVLSLSALPLVACGGTQASPHEPEPTASTEESSPSEEEAMAEQLAEDGTMGEESEPAPDTASAPAASGEEDTRTTEVMAKVVQDNRHLFRLCYEKEQKNDPKLKGDLVITFTVSPQGKVTKAEMDAASSTLKSEEVGKCAAEEMKKLTFPESSKGMESTVNYPFNFNPKGPAAK